MLAGRHIILGVTGGIAAYKSAFLVRELVRAGAEVQVAMTEAATRFITPLTMGTLSRRDVMRDILPSGPDRPAGAWTHHVELGQWADCMVIAPATANTIAKIVAGMADNAVTTLVLALRCPLVVAPAMDVDMWNHPFTQRNIETLRSLGVHIIDPESGELASGLSGPGRLPEPGVMLTEIERVLESGSTQDLRGKHVLVTAGPTHEAIDPVRFLGNRSSGKMGFALAGAAARRGAKVTLVAGPVAQPTPTGVARIDVTSAMEMCAALEKVFPAVHVLIMAAAVGDFAPADPSPMKLKREAMPAEPVLHLRRNPDILRMLGEKKERQVLIGFALETENGIPNALRKLKEKHLDMIVLNNPLGEGAAFGADTNVVTLITSDGKAEELPKMIKADVARVILDRAVLMIR
jgi:phosphopantothenoylcysteine decarboxylase/phosphopantothenate--cysteine ligase